MKQVFIFIVLSIGFISQCVQSKSLRARNEINESFEESLSGSDNFESDSVNKLQALNKQNHNQTKQIILDENDEAFKILFENFSKKFLNFKTTTMKERIQACQVDQSNRHPDWNPICDRFKKYIDSIIEYSKAISDFRDRFESYPLTITALALAQSLSNITSAIGMITAFYAAYADPYKNWISSPQAMNKIMELRQNIK